MWKIALFMMAVTSYAAHAGVVKCGPGETLETCPTNCTDSCPTRSGEFDHCTRPKDCPPPKCVCQFNYRRAVDGTCIPTTECPAFECPEPNEIYNPCPAYYPTEDCSQAKPHWVCHEPRILRVMYVECVPACRCKPTYCRQDGVCVPYQHCNKIDNLESLLE